MNTLAIEDVPDYGGMQEVWRKGWVSAHGTEPPVGEYETLSEARRAGFDTAALKAGKSRLWEALAEINGYLQRQRDEADKKRTDGKNSGGNFPKSPRVSELCDKLKSEIPKGKSQIAIARDFTKEAAKHAPDAEQLLRQARRYRHLWE